MSDEYDLESIYSKILESSTNPANTTEEPERNLRSRTKNKQNNVKWDLKEFSESLTDEYTDCNSDEDRSKVLKKAENILNMNKLSVKRNFNRSK